MTFPDSEQEIGTEFPPDPGVLRDTPRHGFQGDRAPAPPAPPFPAALTVAVSREAGSRGGSIARRTGRKLGWQVYNQELLEYIAQEGSFRTGVVENLSPGALDWAEGQLQQQLREQNLSQHAAIVELARLILALGAQGDVV